MINARFPYLDYVLSQLARRNKSLEKCFGVHLHWGYWQTIKKVVCSDEEFHLAAEKLSHKLCNIARIKNNEKILDVGCGFGGTLSYINNHFSGVNLTGLNIDQRQLERARNNVVPKAKNKIIFKEADACHLPFPDNSFDKVIAVECIFHFSNREQFIKEAFRVLKPGGTLTISDFITSPALWLGFKFCSLPIIRKFNFFGYVNLSTLNNYRNIALRNYLEMETVDITQNTLPTYNYLISLSKKKRLGGIFNMLARPWLEFMLFISKHHLLEYRIISFIKNK